MRTEAFEKIMAILIDISREDGGDEVFITLKNGDVYTFDMAENDDMMPESCEIDGTIQLFEIRHKGKKYRTAWIEVSEIATIRI